LAALREAFSACQACVALLAEAARLQVLGWAAPAAAPAAGQAAARVAQLFLGVVRRVAEAGADDEGADVDGVVVAAVSHAARLARNLAPPRAAPAPATRDLHSALQLAAGAGGAVEGGADAVCALATALMELTCSEAGAAAAVGAKPHLPGLVAALGGEAAAAGGGGGRWLAPLAQLLGAGVDLSDVAPIELAAPEEAAADQQQQDENSSAAANQPRRGARGKAAARAAAPATAGLEVRSSDADNAAVKQLVAAAKAAGVQERLAGQAAAAAAAAWAAGDAAGALGGVELAQLLGFKGVNARGRSRAGGESYGAAAHALRSVQDAVAGGGGVGQGAAPAAAALRHKLQALFPPAPRVTFTA
jgi:hypothetical protein